MKKEWETPSVTVLILKSDDIICASGESGPYDDEDIGEWH